MRQKDGQCKPPPSCGEVFELDVQRNRGDGVDDFGLV
jgi:hypothetical protein